MAAAAEAFEDAAFADPENAEAHFLLARSLLELGNSYRALDALQTAERLRPDHAPQRILLGRLYVRLSRFDEAEAILTRAVESWPEEPRAHAALGRLRFRQGRLGEAELSLTRAVRMAPRLPGAQELLGRVLLRLGRTDQAISRFEAAVEQRQCDDLAHGGLAAALLVALHPGRAQAEFLRAAECAGPERAAPWRTGVALAQAAEGRHADAASGIVREQSSFFDPPAAAALGERLTVLAESGWRGAGCTAHETICAQAGQRFWSAVLLLFVLGAPDAAERELREALTLFDGDALTHWALAEALAELDRSEDALLELDRAGAWEPSEAVQAALAALRAELEAR